MEEAAGTVAPRPVVQDLQLTAEDPELLAGGVHVATNHLCL